jgi:hypothetical protein
LVANRPKSHEINSIQVDEIKFKQILRIRQHGICYTC